MVSRLVSAVSKSVPSFGRSPRQTHGPGRDIELATEFRHVFALGTPARL